MVVIARDGQQQTQQKKHIHPVPLILSARTCLADQATVVGEHGLDLALISAVLIAPLLRRIGRRVEIEDAGSSRLCSCRRCRLKEIQSDGVP
ncbi:hypothetical protein FXW78_19270 [Rhodococcus opacus]|nr:hypothetical protein [Rhodococcus opacus]